MKEIIAHSPKILPIIRRIGGSIGILLAMTQVLHAQESASKSPTAASGAGPHPAVLRAKILIEQTVPHGAENGADLIIRRIEEPVLTAEELKALQPPAPKELTEIEKAARRAVWAAARAKLPVETRLFTPSVILYPGQISLIRWWSWDSGNEFGFHEVWVSGVDMSLLPAVGDLNVGRRRWMLMATCSTTADGKSAAAPEPPAPWEFAAPASPMDLNGTPVLVGQGNPSAEALEPLTALLHELKNNAESLAGIMSRRQAAAEQEQREAEARAKAPPQPAVVHFWTSDADEVSTLSRKAAEGRK